MMTTKICGRCKQEKDISEFRHRNKNGKLIAESYCLECEREYQHDWYMVRQEEEKQKRREYYANHRDEAAERSRKYAQTERYKEYHRRYYQEHKAEFYAYSLALSKTPKMKEWRRQYNQEHKDMINARARKNAKKPQARLYKRMQAHQRRHDDPFSITPEQWQVLVDFFDGKCAYCGKEGKLEMDHFWPVSKGGLGIMGNILPVCGTCNRKKSNYAPFAWLPKEAFDYCFTLLWSA